MPINSTELAQQRSCLPRVVLSLELIENFEPDPDGRVPLARSADSWDGFDILVQLLPSGEVVVTAPGSKPRPTNSSSKQFYELIGTLATFFPSEEEVLVAEPGVASLAALSELVSTRRARYCALEAQRIDARCLQDGYFFEELLFELASGSLGGFLSRAGGAVYSPWPLPHSGHLAQAVHAGGPYPDFAPLNWVTMTVGTSVLKLPHIPSLLVPLESPSSLSTGVLIATDGDLGFVLTEEGQVILDAPWLRPAERLVNSNLEAFKDSISLLVETSRVTEGFTNGGAQRSLQELRTSIRDRDHGAVRPGWTWWGEVFARSHELITGDPWVGFSAKMPS
jgi:hypothetical protein